MPRTTKDNIHFNPYGWSNYTYFCLITSKYLSKVKFLYLTAKACCRIISTQCFMVRDKAVHRGWALGYRRGSGKFQGVQGFVCGCPYCWHKELSHRAIPKKKVQIFHEDVQKAFQLLCDFNHFSFFFFHFYGKVVWYLRVFGVIRLILELPEVKCDFADENGLLNLRHILWAQKVYWSS